MNFKIFYNFPLSRFFIYGRFAFCILVCALLTSKSNCQAQYEYNLSEPTTVTNVDEFAQQNLTPYKDLILNGYTLTLNISDSQSITKYFNVKGDASKDSNIVVKTGQGALTIPQSTTVVFSNSVNVLTIAQGELVLERGNCIKVNSYVEIQQDGVLTVKAPMGGAFLSNLTGCGILNANTTDTTGVILDNSRDSEFSGVISGTGNLFKTGDGTLTLSGANTCTGKIEVSKGSLTLKDDAVVANGEVYVVGSELTYEVTSGERTILITDATKIYNTVDKLIKSGDGTLKIYSEALYGVRAESWVISSGRIDCEGYFGTFQNGIQVESGATFSPGLSIGEYMTRGSDITIQAAGIALFEFDSYNENPDQQNFDAFVIEDGPSYTFTLNEGAIVDLVFLNRDAESWAKEGAEYQLVDDINFAKDKDYSSALSGNYGEMFQLVGRKNQGLFLIGRGAPEPGPEIAVPEPSTWALLILGAAGLLYVRKRVRS